MGHTPVIDVTSLTKRYGTLTAVNDISFQVVSGECVAMLGPNGAGKTVTTEILAGFRHADEGHVTVLGENPRNASRQWRSRIGVVLQTCRDLPELTVTEAITHVATFFSDPRDVDDVIEITGLTAKAKDRIGRLSGGQRRRVDVALGIVGKPELLFLDEPTTGFDPVARREFWDLITALKDERTTILLTTHYLEEAERLADRVIVIADGSIIASGTAAELGEQNGDAVTVRWSENNQQHERLTATPTAFLRELSTQFDGEIPRLEVIRPTLEDTYLALLSRQEQP